MYGYWYDFLVGWQRQKNGGLARQPNQRLFVKQKRNENLMASCGWQQQMTASKGWLVGFSCSDATNHICPCSEPVQCGERGCVCLVIRLVHIHNILPLFSHYFFYSSVDYARILITTTRRVHCLV